MLPAREGEDVGGVTAPSSLDVEGVGHAPIEHGQGVGHGERLVEAVRVQGHLDVDVIGHPQGGVDRHQGRAGVLMHLEAGDMGVCGFVQCGAARRRGATEDPDVEGHGLERLAGDAEEPR